MIPGDHFLDQNAITYDALFSIISPQFGVSTSTLNNALGSGNSGNAGSGGFSPLYQMGGPRSVQLSLKLRF
jgi:hypothetical protein